MISPGPQQSVDPTFRVSIFAAFLMGQLYLMLVIFLTGVSHSLAWPTYLYPRCALGFTVTAAYNGLSGPSWKELDPPTHYQASLNSLHL